MTTVVGADGAGFGWASVLLVDSQVNAASFHPTLPELLDGYPSAQVIGIDLPIGLTDDVRHCDEAAARFLHGRRSTVFAMPSLQIAGASDYDAARRLWRELGRTGSSIQAWGLAAKALRCQSLIVDRDATGERIIEVHPEICFAAMNQDQPLLSSKKTWDGHTERLHLLANEGIDLGFDLVGLGPVRPDDLIDAASAAWTAHRFATQRALSLPAQPTQRLAGTSRPIAIWR